MSSFCDIFKEQMSSRIIKKSVRISDPFGLILHIDYDHGLCKTIIGGSMHVFYQLIISIEKATLVPITFRENLFKSFLESYGKELVDLQQFEEDLRAVRTLDELSCCGNSKKALQFSEVLSEEFNILIMSKIGVPSYFPFTIKNIYSCDQCNKVSEPSIASQYILKLDISSVVRSISLSELIR